MLRSRGRLAESRGVERFWKDPHVSKWENESPNTSRTSALCAEDSRFKPLKIATGCEAPRQFDKAVGKGIYVDKCPVLSDAVRLSSTTPWH